MSQQGNFFGGFLLGAVMGGAVGGVIGVLAASRLSQTETTEGKASETKPAKKRQVKAAPEQNMEVARRGLEDKIAQLNEAIDDVRQQLGTVNGSEPNREQSALPEP